MSNKKLSQLPDNAAPNADGTSVAAVTASTTGGVTAYTNQIVTVRNLVKAGVQAGGVGLATVATTGSYTNLTNVPATFPPSSHNHDDRYYTEAETDTLLAGKQATGNYATLDGSGRVPAAQLPSYVDDVEEYANFASLPATGQQGKIYVALDTNKIYRWSGTVYLEISPSPGSTDSVAEGTVNLYYTNTRAAAAAPVQSVAGRTGAVVLTKTDVGLANVPNTDATLRSNHTGTQAATTITGLSTVATSGSYTDLSNRPATFPPSAHTHPTSDITGLGTIATQNANSVAITGGSINGTSIGATTASTGAFTTVTTTGNVGIGTASPSGALDVAGNAYFNSSLGGGFNHVTIRGNAPGINWGTMAFTTRVGTSDVNIAAISGVIETNTSGSESGGFIFFTKASAGALSEKVRITSGGNVGIGTTSPQNRLHVDASSNFSPLSVGGSDAVSGIQFRNTGATLGYIYYDTTPSMIFHVAASEKMRIVTNGNVGIGTTSPGQRLHVAGSGQGIFIEDTGANRAVLSLTASNTELRIQGTAYVNASQPLTIWTANTERMRITETGNVGIGTASPTQLLTAVRSGTGIVGRFTDNTTQTLDIGLVASAGVYIDNPNSGYVDFRIGGSSRMRVDSTGNVGIGTASPSSRLHVAGGTITTDDGAISPRSIGPETIIEFTGNRTLALTDAGRLLVFTGTATTGITVPADASVNFPVGTRITVMHANADGTGNTQLNFLPFGGTPTIRASTDALTGPFSRNGFDRIPGEATITKIGANLWVLTGNARQR